MKRRTPRADILKRKSAKSRFFRRVLPSEAQAKAALDVAYKRHMAKERNEQPEDMETVIAT